MRLIFSTKDFKVLGGTYVDFPILLNSRMEIVDEVLLFLIKYCIKRGRVSSKKSWRAYGQTMYDYFSFLEANNLYWDKYDYGNDHTVIAAYRDWSISEAKLSPSTVNYRLRMIIKFYQFAFDRGWINQVPYELENVIVTRGSGFFSHVDSSVRKRTPDVMLKTPSTRIKLLDKPQVIDFLKAIKNPTQRLMARLSLSSGLRKEELATFPVKYIFDPKCYLTHKSLIRVNLDPNDMKTKGNKSRGIDIPRLLMESLWQYVLHERNHLEKVSENKYPELFLNKNGRPWAQSGKSLNNLWKNLGLPFKVTPHMLRHTYATYTLFELRKRKIQIDPLLYVRDRLGHASIQTTEKYLHYLSEIEEQLMTDYQNDLDLIFEEIR
jgi:integrase